MSLAFPAAVVAVHKVEIEKWQASAAVIIIRQ
jgi:hypothetical protein